jgi:hypothetical protein
VPTVDATAAAVLARLLTDVLTSCSGSAMIDAGRLILGMEQQGWLLVKLPTATDVVTLHDGGRRADFGTVVATVYADGVGQVSPNNAEITPEQGAIQMLAAARWVMAEQVQMQEGGNRDEPQP